MMPEPNSRITAQITNDISHQDHIRSSPRGVAHGSRASQGNAANKAPCSWGRYRRKREKSKPAVTYRRALSQEIPRPCPLHRERTEFTRAPRAMRPQKATTVRGGLTAREVSVSRYRMKSEHPMTFAAVRRNRVHAARQNILNIL